MEELEKNESLAMIGAQRFSNYRGYASTFEWAGPHLDQIPRYVTTLSFRHSDNKQSE